MNQISIATAELKINFLKQMFNKKHQKKKSEITRKISRDHFCIVLRSPFEMVLPKMDSKRKNALLLIYLVM